MTKFFSSCCSIFVDTFHDIVEFSINFFECPLCTSAVLCHFKGWYGNTTGVSSFGRTKWYTSFKEDINSSQSWRHVSTFWNSQYTICYKCFCICFIQFILSCTWECQVSFNWPNCLFTTSRCEGCIWTCFCIFNDTFTFNFFDFFQQVNVDSVWIINKTRWVRTCYRFSTKALQFFDSVDGNVTSTWNNCCFTVKVFTTCIKHLFCKVNSTVTSCFCTSKWSTPVQTFTSKNTCVLVTKTFVLAVEVTNFTSTNTDITCSLLNSVMKLWQKRMISLSDLPLGSKFDPPLPPPIGWPVNEFLKICSKPRNLMIDWFTDGWKRRPPL